jgi:hypothetical protein
MRWIGQHIWDFVSRFRNKVVLEDLSESTEEYTIMVKADGELVKSVHPMEQSRLQVRNDEGSTIPAGAPLYSRGEIGGSERVKVGIADASDANKMPCIGIAFEEMNTSSTKDNFAISQGVYNTNISGFTGLSAGDILYVDDSASSPYLTHDKAAIAGSANKIQNVGIVLRTNGTICQGLLVSAIGRTNDVPNLDEDTIFLGSASNQTVATALSSVGLSKFNNDAGFVTSSGISNVVEDTTPQLGGNLDAQGNNITGVGDISLTGNISVGGTVDGVDIAGRDHDSVTLAGEDYLSLSGQQITANDIDLTDNVTGILPIANGGTGSSTQKVIQIFPMNFVDDLGTTKHFMPFVTNVEQTVNYQEEAAMVMPADGKVVSVTVHMAQMHNNDGNITIGIETSPCGQSYTNAWTVEETETLAATQTDDHHVFHFAFDNAKHFDSTDKMAISIQQSADMQSANRFFWVSAVIEYDWSTFLGGTSAEYTTTP